MRSILAGLRTLVVPWGATQPPRIVIGTDDPLAQSLSQESAIVFYTETAGGFVWSNFYDVGPPKLDQLALFYTNNTDLPGDPPEYITAYWNHGVPRAALHLGLTVASVILTATQELFIGSFDPNVLVSIAGDPVSFDTDAGFDDTGSGSPISMSRGIRGVISSTANSAAVSAETAVLTLGTFTFRDSRAYRIAIGGRVAGSVANGALFQVRRTSAAGTVIGIIGAFPVTGSGGARPAHGECYVSNSTGSDITDAVVLTLTASTGTCTHTAAANAKRYLEIRDAGAASKVTQATAL